MATVTNRLAEHQFSLEPIAHTNKEGRIQQPFGTVESKATPLFSAIGNHGMYEIFRRQTAKLGILFLEQIMCTDSLKMLLPSHQEEIQS